MTPGTHTKEHNLCAERAEQSSTYSGMYATCTYRWFADTPAPDAAACTSLAVWRQQLVVGQCLQYDPRAHLY